MKKFTILALLCSAFLAAGPLQAEVKMSDETKRATDRALAWLATQQNEDGSFSDGGYAHNTAITGYALLAFMSRGHLPNQGFHGPEVTKAARFLMASSRPADGYLVGARGGNMYCHGMATLALAELWGQTNNDELRPVVKKAVELIVGCQSPDGGWHYEPRPTGSDISVTIMQVMALRSAKNAGLNVPKETLDKAIGYIKSCYLGPKLLADPKRGPGTVNERGSFGFTYQPGSGAPGFARTAAGTCVLYLTATPEDRVILAKEIRPAVNFMNSQFETPGHFFYGHYYAAHAMHQVGGKDWDDWYGRIEKFFLPQQSPDGSWAAARQREVGPVYQTSIAVIILSVPAHYLPIFQN